jgi:hypothetical protein
MRIGTASSDRNRLAEVNKSQYRAQQANPTIPDLRKSQVKTRALAVV